MKWKQPAANRMLLVMIKRPANIFSLIVRRKLPGVRTSLCYDREGLESRKEHRPKNTAMDKAAAMGIELLTEEQYQELQKFGDFDTKTSSWVKTPSDIRKLGGALYCDRRYGRVFVGHNGAQSYYAAGAFRGWLRGLNFAQARPDCGRHHRSRRGRSNFRG